MKTSIKLSLIFFILLIAASGCAKTVDKAFGLTGDLELHSAKSLGQTPCGFTGFVKEEGIWYEIPVPKDQCDLYKNLEGKRVKIVGTLKVENTGSQPEGSQLKENVDNYTVYPASIVEIKTDISNGNKIYTVDELKKSDLPEKTLVQVKIKHQGCKIYNLKVTEDYEGPGSGTYLDGLKIEGEDKGKICLPKYEGKEIVISGKTRVCGGEKVEEYVCGISEVKLIED